MQVITPEEIAQRERREVNDDQGTHSVTPFFGGDEGSDVPLAFRVDFAPLPGGTVRPHFHKVAQFQVVVAGDAHLGKRHVPPVSFHFADPSTPYGPIAPVDEELGFSYLTLRPAVRNGLYWMPGSKSEMSGRAGRNIAAKLPDAPLPAEGSACDELIERQADGLAAYAVRLAAGEQTRAPAAEGSGGQYHLVTQGSLLLDGNELRVQSLLFVAPDEHATLTAGAEGAEVLVLQFPTRILPDA